MSGVGLSIVLLLSVLSLLFLAKAFSFLFLAKAFFLLLANSFSLCFFCAFSLVFSGLHIVYRSGNLFNYGFFALIANRFRHTLKLTEI